MSTDQTPAKPKTPTFKRRVAFVLASALTAALAGALLLWPWTFAKLGVLWAAPTTEYWGRVQQVRYVGTLSPSTQVDTESKTFLVWGVLTLEQGTPLQKREDFFSREICRLDTGQCWDLASH